MASVKPSVPKGMRDFSPAEMVKRNYIFDTIKSVFRKYGYQQIETPTMENSATLMGKYGDEGDRLIFKVINSGEYFNTKTLDSFFTELDNGLREFETTLDSEVNDSMYDFIDKINSAADEREKETLHNEYNKKFLSLNQKTRAIAYNKLTQGISEKALRYDLTVPFARYVVQHQNEITFPFKRFQVQPVWRADRPQKGRYREFYQCDADVVGSDSLLNEAEFILIYDEALSKLGLTDFTIKINNRKILAGIAEIIGKPELIVDMTVAIDKLDKIGLDGVVNELLTKGFVQEDIDRLEPVILLEGTNAEKLDKLKAILATSEVGLKGIAELEVIFTYLQSFSLQKATVELDITLARGLNYYTGAIFEVKTNETYMGSIGGGGRYDDLTGMFGLKGLTGAGISFGADRIYDVLEELKLFPEASNQTTKVLIVPFDIAAEAYALPLLQQLRNSNVNAELYPAGAKIKKQLDYANNKNIPYVVVIGSDEVQSGQLTFKNMQTGEQQKLSAADILEVVK